MSINHLISPIQQPRLDIYVREIEAQALDVEFDIKCQNLEVSEKVVADNFRLLGQQELAVGTGDANQGLFATNLNVRPSSSTWVSLISIEQCKLTRDKLHFNPQTSKFRKVFNFCFNFALSVDYALRAGATSISLDFVCNGFPDFVPATPLDARINKLIYNQGNYQSSANTGASGQIRCFQDNNIGVEGFTIVLLPPATFLSAGTDQLVCQVSCSIMDSEEIDV